MEFFLGCFTVLLYILIGTPFETLRYFIFIYFIILLSLIDVKTMLVPRQVLGAGFFFGILSMLFSGTPTPLNALFGIAVGFMLLYPVHLIKPEGMGAGDPQFTAMLGLFLGWKGIIIGVISGTMLGGIVGVILLATGKAGPKTRLPFIPFLAAGGLISFFLGKTILKFYFG